jgi:hypothetical protein
MGRARTVGRRRERTTHPGSLATGYITFSLLLLLTFRYPCPRSLAKETQTHCSLAEVNSAGRNFFSFWLIVL